MREYLADPPRWVMALLTGLPFGAALRVYSALQGATWRIAERGQAG